MKNSTSSIAILFLLSLGQLGLSSPAHAAACCGGGFASPTLIVGDHHSQLTATSSFGEIVVDNVDGGGYWRRAENHTTLETFNLEGATLISDRWQVGGSLPLIGRNRIDDHYFGLGDVSATLGYEYLTDWDYNPWRPKGIGFLQLTFPTGKSRFESDNGGLDSRGNGFWALGAGTFLTKIFGNFDTFVTFQAHRSFDKHVDTDMLSGELSPGYGGTAGFGAGYNTDTLRFGGALTWTVEQPVHFEGGGVSFDESVERYATAVLSVSYMWSDQWAATISFIDQTWFGAPINTSLARSGAFLIQRRWPR